MRSFQHIASALRLYGGDHALEQLPRELDRLKAGRAVIVCGSTLAQPGSPLDLVKAALGGRCAGVLPCVRAHSPVPAVRQAAQDLKRLGADAVVAVGGGSAVVTARAASILLAEGADVHDLCTTAAPDGSLKSPKLMAPKLPQLVVPTTPTTATVKAGSAVYDEAANERLPLFDPKTRAQAVFVHPALILSAPRALVVSSSLNTMTMAIDGLLSKSGDPISDALLMHALRLVVTRLPDPTLDSDAAVRGDLMLASLMCGQGTDHTGAGIATVLGHGIGMRCHADNGLINAVVLPHALRFNAQEAPEGLQKAATALGHAGTDPAARLEAVIEAVETLAASLGVARHLRDLGVPRESLAPIAARAMDDWFLRGNPRKVRDASELQQLMELAW